MRRAFGVSFFLVVAGAAIGCGGKHEGKDDKIVTPVRVRLVEERTQLAGSRYSGSLGPATRVDLAFKVGGYVKDIAQVTVGGETRKVQEGDFVSKGTVLAVVREGDYQQKVTAAQAGLAEAVAVRKQAELDYERTKSLLASSSISKTEFDAQSARLDIAVARAEGARSRIEEAQLALADCTIRAPLDGVVLKRPIEVGTLVSPGTLAFVIADTRTVKVLFGAPDRLVEKLKSGGTLAVTFDAVAGEFSGIISRIAPSADPKSRVFEIEATIPNPKGELKVGMIAKLVVPEASLVGSALVLPLTAVVRSPRDPRGFSVFVVESNGGKEVARLRDVKLGEIVGNGVMVGGGLANNERVVSMGATLLTDGETVRVIPN